MEWHSTPHPGIHLDPERVRSNLHLGCPTQEYTLQRRLANIYLTSHIQRQGCSQHRIWLGEGGVGVAVYAWQDLVYNLLSLQAERDWAQASPLCSLYSSLPHPQLVLGARELVLGHWPSLCYIGCEFLNSRASILLSLISGFSGTSLHSHLCFGSPYVNVWSGDTTWPEWIHRVVLPPVPIKI